MSESLVDVSPSTVMRLNEASATSRASSCKAGWLMLASVAIKPSMVAILGRIIPAPLLMPLMCAVLSPSATLALKALGTVSVVMMPCAAWNHCVAWGSACALAMTAGKPATKRSTGSGSMMTPVEYGSTDCGSTPSALAKAAQVARASASPCAPVPALALPVLISRARTGWPLARCSRQTCTGAAQNRFCVKTPATLAPGSSRKTVRSRRPALRMPACAVPMRTPAIGSKDSGAGLCK